MTDYDYWLWCQLPKTDVFEEARRKVGKQICESYGLALTEINSNVWHAKKWLEDINPHDFRNAFLRQQVINQVVNECQ